MIEGADIRAVAVSAPLPRGGDVKAYVEEVLALEISEYARALAKELGVSVRTCRLVFPYLEDLSTALNTEARTVVEGLCDAIEDAREIDYVALPLRRAENASWIVEVLRRYEKAFFSIPYSRDEEAEIARLIRDISTKAGPVEAAHFAVSFGEQPQTPYFPATASREAATMLSLLYPTYLRRAVRRGDELHRAVGELARRVTETAEAALKSFNVPKRLYLDYSLSPWMEDSVAAVIEDLKGGDLTRPGTHSAILEINSAIRDAAERYKGLGYNEVMLSVAEDNRLKELVASGKLGLQLLVSYVSVCVAGLDMVLLPLGIDDRFLVSLMRDLDAIRSVKGRAVGMRVILVDAGPGDIVELGFFGRTPVADPYR